MILNELKVMSWNIKGGASLGWNNSRIIKKEVVDKIIEQQAHIVVLTEFVVIEGIDYLFRRLKQEGYIWFLKCESGKNGILIAVKKVVVDANRLKKEVNEAYKVYDKKLVLSSDDGCNILRVDLPLNGCENSTLTVIGCRMETGGKDQEQYDSERKCLDEILIPMINTSKDLCIVCGDFNNARCMGNLSKKYNLDDYKINGEPLAQVNYNLNIIKDTFEDLGFEMMDIEDGKPIFTHKGYLAEDHIFTRGFTKKSCSASSADGLSDHDIIAAEIEINI